MKRTKYLLPLLILLLIGCSIFDPHEPETMNSEQHAVISAVIDSMMSSDSVYVFDQSTPMINIRDIRLGLIQDTIFCDLTLLSNYRNTNRLISHLDADWLPGKVVLKEIDTTTFYSGNWRFSCPGISTSGKFAIVEFSHLSGSISGGGMVAMLKKQDGEWQIVWYEMIWIS